MLMGFFLRSKKIIVPNNNMNNIFIAVTYGGEWEDKWSQDLIASFDEQKIKDYIEQRKKQDELDKANSLLLERFEEEYREKNPGPANKHEYISFPKLAKDIVLANKVELYRQEQSQKRKVIHKQNELLSQLHKQAMSIWLSNLAEFKKTFSSSKEDFEKYISENPKPVLTLVPIPAYHNPYEEEYLEEKKKIRASNDFNNNLYKIELDKWYEARDSANKEFCQANNIDLDKSRFYWNEEPRGYRIKTIEVI